MVWVRAVGVAVVLVDEEDYDDAAVAFTAAAAAARRRNCQLLGRILVILGIMVRHSSLHILHRADAEMAKTWLHRCFSTPGVRMFCLRN